MGFCDPAPTLPGAAGRFEGRKSQITSVWSGIVAHTEVLPNLPNQIKEPDYRRSDLREEEEHRLLSRFQETPTSPSFPAARVWGRRSCPCLQGWQSAKYASLKNNGLHNLHFGLKAIFGGSGKDSRHYVSEQLLEMRDSF